MKYKTKLLIFSAAAALTLFVLREIYCAVMYLYNISVKRGDKTFLTRLIDVSGEAGVLMDDFKEEGKRIARWAKVKKTQSVEITGFDKTKLYGEIFSADSDKWVIILHGYGGEGSLMYYAGEVFFEKGFNVLIPDLRGHGRSGGSYIAMGWQDREDIIKWIKLICKRNKKAKILLYGVSMGGAAVLMASGEKLPKNVKAVTADCAYTSVSDIFKCQMKKMRIPAFPLLHLTAVLCRFKNGYNIFTASALKQTSKSKLPVLFIHGEADTFVPVKMLEALYSAKKHGYKEKHIFKAAGHGVSAMVDKENYWNTVFSFLDKIGFDPTE